MKKRKGFSRFAQNKIYIRSFMRRKRESWMNIRENLEQFELEYLSPYASFSRNSKGRLKEEEQCDIRPVYQRDRDRILHSKSFSYRFPTHHIFVQIPYLKVCSKRRIWTHFSRLIISCNLFTINARIRKILIGIINSMIFCDIATRRFWKIVNIQNCHIFLSLQVNL